MYRQEAREALKVRLEGEVVALAPPALKKLTAVCLGVAVAAAVFGCVATYTKYVPAGGVVAPRDGLVTVTAPFKGDIVSILGRQGQLVKAGETLALMRNTQAQAAGADTYARDKDLLATRKTVTKDLYQAKLAELQQTVTSNVLRAEGVQRTLTAARAAHAAAKAKGVASLAYLERQRKLVAEGYLAPAGALPAEQAYLSDLQLSLQAEQAVTSLAAELTAAEQGVAQAQAQMTTLNAQGSESAVVLDMDASRLSAAGEAAISSSQAGTVAAVAALPGPVAAGAPLFVVVPPGPLYAHLMLSEAAAQKAKVGQNVALHVLEQSRSDSVKWKAVLVSIAAAPVPVPTDNGTAAKYLALALVEAQPNRAIPVGARVEARLQVEEKSLAGWLVDPLVRGLRQTTLGTK